MLSPSLQLLETCDLVVDVGGVYDPTVHRYDHHQRCVSASVGMFAGVHTCIRIRTHVHLFLHLTHTCIRKDRHSTHHTCSITHNTHTTHITHTVHHTTHTYNTHHNNKETRTHTCMHTHTHTHSMSLSSAPGPLTVPCTLSLVAARNGTQN